MSRHPLTLGATEDFDSTLVDIEDVNYTLVNTEAIDIKPFIPPSLNAAIPTFLFYEKYQTDNLWNPSRGLETAGKVVGFALDEHFFKNVLDKHLSYPVHTIPWFFSPFISANAHILFVNRGNRASRPQSVFLIRVKSLFEINGLQAEEQPYIYSLRRLVAVFDIPASKYKNRPYWEHEYLILKRVPAEAILSCELEEIDECMLTWS